MTAAASTTSLAASLNPAATGQSVTLTATVTCSAASGSVTFKDGTTTLGTGTLSSGVATLATPFSAAGARSLTAAYAGSAAYGASSSAALTETIYASGTLPPPPVSPVPVVNFEYDAQGNPTRTIQTPGVTGFGFTTSATYDAMDRRQATTDARSGVTAFGYDG